MGWTSLIGTEVSDVPKLAPQNFKEFEPFVWDRTEKNGKGSGVLLKEVPFYTEPWQAKYQDTCGACGSKKTQCIYAEFWNDWVGKDDEYELICLECGKFTRYHYFD